MARRRRGLGSVLYPRTHHTIASRVCILPGKKAYAEFGHRNWGEFVPQRALCGKYGVISSDLLPGKHPMKAAGVVTVRGIRYASFHVKPVGRL